MPARCPHSDREMLQMTASAAALVVVVVTVPWLQLQSISFCAA